MATQDLEKFTLLPTFKDEQQIMLTFARYTEALDSGDALAWVACFTENVAYSVCRIGSDEPMHEARGREALLAYRLANPVVRLGAAWQHLVTKQRVLVDGSGQRASGHSYWTSIAADPDPVILGFGVYHDLLERQADGTWLIANRITEAHGT
jgi:SnoaL-like domain